MSTAFRASAQVVNGTAGTSVVVPRPTGTADGDVLVAFIATAGAASTTAPAGWELITFASAGGNVVLRAYWKVASGEPASWTWTLDASQRNWGVVAGYTGADPIEPVAGFGTDDTLDTSTVLKPANATLPDAGQGVAAAAAIRTASGTATTWAHSSTERNDLSTNAGSGTDISGVVGDTANPNPADVLYGPTLTASQAQTDGVAISVTLNPLFVLPSPGTPLGVLVEAAFGADPDADLSTVDWTDISASVRPNLRYRKGVLNENGQSDPTRIDFEINNPAGDFTPDNPSSIYWPNIQLDTPIRVSLQGIGIKTYERATAFVDSWAPSWNDGPDWSVVTVSCGGRLQRLQEGHPPIKSPAWRNIVGNDPPPLDFWALEDGPDSASAANAVSGGKPAAVSSGTFAGESTLPGAASAVTLAAGGKVIGTVRRYTATGLWWVAVALRLPVPVTSTTTVLEIFTSGAAQRWQLQIVPGTPDVFTVRAYDSVGASLLNTGVSITGDVTEGDVYGKWCLFSLGTKQNGTQVDYAAFLSLADRAVGKSGNLLGTANGNVRWASTTATSEQDGMGVASLAVNVDPSFPFVADPLLTSAAVLAGLAGESPEVRFVRLCNEERVPHLLEFAGTSPTVMGPQQAGSFVQTLRDIEAVDAGILHDGGPLGQVVFSQRGFRYNKAVGLTLTGDQIMKDFQPRFDTQARKGEVTASRPNGASYVFASGAPGLQDSIQANVESDSQLPSVASWRSSRGQAKGMRYPSFGIDLRAHPELAEAWLASGISTRVNLNIDLPQHPTATVDLFIDGYAEELDSTRWVVNPINCSPARPQGEVFQLESTVGNRGRLDTAGSKLAAAVDAGGVLNSNSGFETSTSPWTVLGGGTLSRSTAQFHSGSAALLFTPDGVTVSPEIRSENVSAVAGTSYLASAWVRCAVSRNVGVGINWRDSGGGLLSSSSTSVAVSAETWTLITVTATAPASTALAQLDVFVGATPPSNNLLWIDEARLETNALLVVNTTAGPRWLPGGSGFDVDLGGEQCRVTGIADATADTFTRSVAAGSWGTTTLGQDWVLSTTPSDYSVTGSVGRIATATIAQLYLATIDTQSHNHQVMVTETLPVVPSGGGFTLRAVGRFTDNSNFYNASVTVAAGGAASISLSKNVAGSGSIIASNVSVGTHAAGNKWTIVLDVDGTAVRAKAWNATTGSDPGYWQVATTDADLPTGTQAGCGVRRESGNTNGTVNVDFDNFTIANMQTFTVQRGLNMSKSHSVGEPVSLWQPPVWAL